jgi:hypothetical protein
MSQSAHCTKKRSFLLASVGDGRRTTNETNSSLLVIHCLLRGWWHDLNENERMNKIDETS